MLTIKKNNLEIPVAELSLLNGKEVLVLGDYDRDLILRVKGSLKVQIQNKFYDILNLDEETTTTQESLVIIDDLSTEILANTLVYNTQNNSLSYYDGTNFVSLYDSNQTQVNTTGLLSFNAEQSITDKKILYSNFGYAVNSFSDIKNTLEEYYENQIMYFESLKEHKILTDINKHRFLEGWASLYLTLEKGGIVRGNVSLFTEYKKASLNIFSEESKNYGDTVQALFLGNPSTNSGILLKQNTGTVYLDLIGESNIFKFRTNDNGSYYDLINIINKKIGLGDEPINAVDLNINLSTLLKKDLYVERNISSFNYSAALRKKELYNNGFALTKQGGYLLETDELLVKNPESSHKVLSAEEGLYGSKSYRIRVIELIYDIDIFVKASLTGRYATQNLNDPVLLNERYPKVQVYDLETETFENIELLFGIGDRDVSNTLMNGNTYDYDGISFSIPIGDYSYDVGSASYVETVGGTHKWLDTIAIMNLTFHSSLGLEVDDLLMYVERTRDKEDQYGAFVHIQTLNTVDDVVIATCHVYGYNRLYLYKEMHLVKVGNKSKDISCLVIQNGNSYLLNGIRNFNQLFSLWYDPTVYENEDSWFINLYPLPNKITSLIGDLTYFDTNIDFGTLIDPEEKGSYFNNIYLKEAHGIFNYLELGTELIWDGVNLDIPRLEQAEQDIEDILLTLDDLNETLEARATFFPTVTTANVYLNFREGEYIKNQTMVTLTIWLNINVNSTGINTIDIENLPFVLNTANDRKLPVLAYVNNEISKEAFIHPITNKITIKNNLGNDYSVAVHEIHLTVSYFI
jgi:hypothetical protein